MNIRPLTVDEFNEFCQTHPLRNYYQTLNYAKLQAEQGYDYELIGYCENSTILAASLILTKKIKNSYYGYAPRGFLIDYTNYYFLKNFTNQLVDYYKKRGFAFLKINPEVAIGKLNPKTKNIEYNNNIKFNVSKTSDNLAFKTKFDSFIIIKIHSFLVLPTRHI